MQPEPRLDRPSRIEEPKYEEELKEEPDLPYPQNKKDFLAALKKIDDDAKELPKTIEKRTKTENKFLRDCVESLSDPSTEHKEKRVID